MKLNSNFLLLVFFITNVIFSQDKITNNSMYNKAKEIHQSIITIDTHIDINTGNFTSKKNYTHNLSAQVDIPKMKKGGLDVAWLIVYTGQDNLNTEGYNKAYKNAISKFEAIHRLIKEYAPNKIELALNSQDVKRIHASKKIAVMIGVENAYSIGLDLNNIEKFYNLGARYISLSHQGHSQFSDSNTGEKENIWLYNNGLSKLGKDAVKEMNSLGIMIDVSHPSKGAFMDMIKLSKAPLIASHSSARALCDHSRNLDNEQLLLLKENGGVVQTVAFAGYLNIEKNNAHKKAKNDILFNLAKQNNFTILNWKDQRKLSKADLEFYNKKFSKLKLKAKPLLAEAEKTYPPVDVSDFVDHIDYMVKLIGIDHVGISSDFDGGGGIEGWSDASETFNVTYELVKRGYNKDQITKLWGLNLLRVLDDVQKIAAGK